MTKESPQDWMKRVPDKISPTFCAAKWFNATIWLGNGVTSSCHHPTPHKIDPEEIAKDPSALHNTVYKKLVRKQMLDGEQPEECGYCWKIENLNKDLVSDRYYKSKVVDEKDIALVHQMKWNDNAPLRTLEIAFDNNCNFACSYCNAGFSTKWAHDINKNGPYQDLESDGWAAFAHNGAWAHPYGPKNTGNPYIVAFRKWWHDELQYTLDELRVTGGEATVSKDFWDLIAWYEDNPDCKVRLSVNTNLGIKQAQLERLIELSKRIPQFDLFTSNECVEQHAEYIRDGLDYAEWKSNVEHAYENGNFRIVHCMFTINALCLASFDQLHEFLFDLRESVASDTNIEMSYNLLRFPSFQSIVTLPMDVRKKKAADMRTWLADNEYRMTEDEINGYTRTIEYVETVLTGHDLREDIGIEKRQNDFFNFYTQYDHRRNKNFAGTFQDWPELVDWYTSLNDNDNKRHVVDLVDADTTEWGKPTYDAVMSKARDDGLIE